MEKKVYHVVYLDSIREELLGEARAKAFSKTAKQRKRVRKQLTKKKKYKLTPKGKKNVTMIGLFAWTIFALGMVYLNIILWGAIL